jgi:hypothetical protein
MISTTVEYCGWIINIVSSTLETGRGESRIKAIARLHKSPHDSHYLVLTAGEKNLRLAYGVEGLFSSEIRAQKAAFDAAKFGIDSLIR